MIRQSVVLALAAGLAAAAPAAADPAREDAFRSRLVSAQAKLTLNMVERLATRRKPMLVISPASLAGAAVALDLGASTQFRGAMHRVLGFRPDADAAADIAAMREQVQKLGAGSGPDSPLRFVNSVVFDRGVALYPGVALAFRQSGIDHAVVDMDAAETAEALNKRIREVTGGLIPDIIDRTPGASLVAVNGLYFKDRWKTPFDRAETRPAPFRRLAGRPISVSTMHLPQGQYLFRQDARFLGIELPYADERFRMVIVTTRGDRPASPRTFRPAGEWLSGKGFALAQGELALPHFDISQRDDLVRVLDGLGLRQARLAADSLSGFSAEPARVTRVLQRVELRVNEEGTEAAAATTAVAERSFDASYVRMIVDRPFLFALRDTATGLILVAGYVGQPAPLATAAQ